MNTSNIEIKMVEIPVYCENGPILLTDEWFRDFDFLCFPSMFEKGPFIISKRINPDEYFFRFKKLTYVHELQILYFSMTGKNLTRK